MKTCYGQEVSVLLLPNFGARRWRAVGKLYAPRTDTLRLTVFLVSLDGRQGGLGSPAKLQKTMQV